MDCLQENLKQIREHLLLQDTHNAMRVVVSMTHLAPASDVATLCEHAIDYPVTFRVVVLRSANVYRNTPEVYSAWCTLCEKTYADLQANPRVNRIMVGIIKDGKPNAQFQVGGTPDDHFWRALLSARLVREQAN